MPTLWPDTAVDRLARIQQSVDLSVADFFLEIQDATRHADVDHLHRITQVARRCVAVLETAEHAASEADTKIQESR